MSNFEQLFSLSGLSLDRLRSFLEVEEAGNLAKAAKGDPVRQSQFSRQVKELESFFGVALTRRVGRRIEITDEGHRLAVLIHRHFSELNDFRESMAGRPVGVKLGAAASLLEWSVIPKLSGCIEALGGVTLELETSRSADVVRGVADGRLDFGIVRDDAVPKDMKRWKLGAVGYALFAPKAAWQRGAGVIEIIGKHPMVELPSGGHFHGQWSSWLAKNALRPNVVARAASFTQLARLLRHAGLAAVLPENASVEFDPGKFPSLPVPWSHRRQMVLLANTRSLDRAGVREQAAPALAKVLAWKPEDHPPVHR